MQQQVSSQSDSRQNRFLSIRVTSRPLAVVGVMLGAVGIYIGSWGIYTIGPHLLEVFAPGSGGTAQMLMAVVLGPLLIVCGFFLLGGAAVCWACLYSIKRSYEKAGE
jgi:hypothetical protein